MIEHYILKLNKKQQHIDESKDKQYYRKERRFVNIQRSIQLPQNIDINNVSAQYLNGVLHVNVPKKEVDKPKSKPISIQ